MSGLVHEHGRLEPYSLLSPEPTEADECVRNVAGVTQAVDEPCCRVHHRLKTPEQAGLAAWLASVAGGVTARRTPTQNAPV